MKSDDFIRYTAAAVAYFISSVAFYINIGQNMGAKYFMPLLLPVIFSLVALQWANGRQMFIKENIPNLLCAVGWGTAFPIIYTWTYQAAWFMSLVSFDFVIATAFFVFLAAGERVLASSFIGEKQAAAIMTVLNFLLLLVPFIEYAYYVMVWHALSPASLMSLYMTNWRESIDFLQANVGVWLLIIFGVIGFLLNRAWRVHRRLIAAYRAEHCPARRTLTAGVLLLFAAYVAFIEYIPDSSVAGLWKDVTSYAAQTAEYGREHERRFADLQVDAANALPTKMSAPTSVIVVIGESASRDYMRAFSPDFPFDDTPWLSEQTDNPDFVVFDHAYSSWSQTVPSLQRALTEQSQYNGKEFLDSVSIVDAAKKAGFHTAWFSNQGRYGQYDSVTTLVAKTADRAEWTDDSYTFTDKYDITLLNFLKTVDPTKNNFIVLHLIGSHIYYYNRYPYQFAEWSSDDAQKLGGAWADTTASYANSIRYTDYVLREIFNYAKENLNLSVMLYFSDHGENLRISHNPDVFSFDMVRIPFFVYMSPEYQHAMPDEAYTLRSNEQTYFTNDMLYDTVCGIIGAKGNRYDPREDFSSRKYRYTRDDLTTMLGQVRIADDPKP